MIETLQAENVDLQKNLGLATSRQNEIRDRLISDKFEELLANQGKEGRVILENSKVWALNYPFLGLEKIKTTFWIILEYVVEHATVVDNLSKMNRSSCVPRVGSKAGIKLFFPSCSTLQGQYCRRRKCYKWTWKIHERNGDKTKPLPQRCWRVRSSFIDQPVVYQRWCL